MIFDSHAHYDDEAFNEDREAILNSLPENGISPIVNVSAQLSGVTATVELTEKYPFIYGSVGVHPDHVGELSEEKIQWMKELAGREKIVAVGEIGLDHYWDTESDEVQRKWFIRQLELAKEVNLPVIIHSREASQETFDIMKEHHAGSTGGVIHCFSYGVEMAREYLNMGFFLGIGGVLTFKNARKLKEVAEYVPLDRIVIETDCPYMAPEPNRGKRNDSSNLKYVLGTLAQIKGLSTDEVMDAVWKNGNDVYRIA